MALETVLIADDNDGFRDGMALVFKNKLGKGVRVITARDGNEAVRLYDEHRPKVVVLDLLMPGRDGAAVLNHITDGRKEAGDSPPYVIIVTGRVDLNAIEEYNLAMDVVEYLGKPIEGEKLVGIVKRYLAK